MKKLTHRLFGGPLRLGGPGPPGPLDKTALKIGCYVWVFIYSSEHIELIDVK